MLKLFVITILSLMGRLVFAYPEFIGYGYSNCMACHYNGAGGGGLTDYGRALYAGELAAKPWWPKATDDELGNASHFLGKKASPYWFKPGLKYRRLMNEMNPGSSNKTTRYYTMQADLNLAMFTSDEATRGLIMTFSHVPELNRARPNVPFSPSSDFMAREYFVRWALADDKWLYIGMMDKAFGIRTPDHTAVNRSPILLGQNDQVHGIKYQKTAEKGDLFVQGFLGNVHQPGDLQSKGFSVMYEHEPVPKFRPGVSLRQEASKLQKTASLAGHLRLGAEKGHALLYELGLKDLQLTGLEKNLGYYQFFEMSYLVNRGLHFQNIIQTEKSKLDGQTAETFRWGLGFLYFPMQRLELRVQALQVRATLPENVMEDQWIAQTQLHFSL